jgi:hypothetical protein
MPPPIPVRTAPGSEPRGYRVVPEVVGLYLVGLAVLFVSGRMSVLGGLSTDLSAALAAGFLLLAPVTMIRRTGGDPARILGLSASGFVRSVVTCLKVAAVVFPAYILAFAGWAAWVEGRPLVMPADPWRDFPADVRGFPDTADAPSALLAWTQDGALMALNTTTATVPVRASGCSGAVTGLVRRDGRLFNRDVRANPSSAGGLEIALAADDGFRCLVGPEFTLTATGGQVSIRSGEGLRLIDGNTLDARKSPLWLFELLLIHLLAVALPEEVFYRGYIQARLAGLFSRRIRFLGVDLGWHVAVTSALFALSHLVAIPAPFRLAVFFPGLLFGWLRLRTGSLVAPVLLHAASNVLLAFLVRLQG